MEDWTGYTCSRYLWTERIGLIDCIYVESCSDSYRLAVGESLYIIELLMRSNKIGPVR